MNRSFKFFILFFVLIVASLSQEIRAEWKEYVFEGLPSRSSTPPFQCDGDKILVSFEYNQSAARTSYTAGGLSIYERGAAFRNLKITSSTYGSYTSPGNSATLVFYPEPDFIGTPTSVRIGGGASLFSINSPFIETNSSWSGKNLSNIAGYYFEFYFPDTLNSLPSLSAANSENFYMGFTGNGGNLEIVSFCSVELSEDSSGGISDDLGVDCYDSLLKLPEQVSASKGLYRDKIEVTWSAVEGAEYYAIYRSNCGSVPLPSGTTVIGGPNPGFQAPDHENWRIGTVPASQLSFTDTDMDAVKVCGIGSELLPTNHYWVRAIRGGCLGQFPGIPQADGYPKDNPPSLLFASKGEFKDKVELSWSAGHGSTGYQVFRSTSNEFSSAKSIRKFGGSIVGLETMSFTDTDVDESVEYFYWVETFDRKGTGPSSSLGVTDSAMGYAGDLNPNVEPTDITLTNNTIAENQEAGTPIGILEASDPNEGDTHTFTLLSVTGGSKQDFKISGETLISNRSFDYETQSQYALKIEAKDSDGLTFEKDLIVTIGDVDEPVIVGDPPVLIKKPSSKLIARKGQSFTLEAVALGTQPLQYLWYKNGVFLAEGPNYTLNPVKSGDGGKYHVRVVNNVGEVSSPTSLVYVVDFGTGENSNNTSPVIGLDGLPLVYLEVGQSYQEPGFTALDLEDGDISDSVSVTGDINNQEPGSYRIHYTVTDSRGLNGTAQRAVIVKDEVLIGEEDNKIARILDDNDVSVFVVPSEDTSNFTVKEVLPEGFSASSISDGGNYNSVSRSIEWGPFVGNQSLELTYELIPPANYSGSVEIQGSATVDGAPVKTDGDTSVVLNNDQDPETSLGSRSISDGPGNIQVELDVNPDDSTVAYAVEEVIPSGFSATSINQGGVFDQVNSKVKWGPYFDNTARDFNYQLVVPNGFSGGEQLDGFISQDGVNTAISGDSIVVIGDGGGEVVASREIVINGSNGSVTVSVTPDGSTVAYAVEEILPSGFSASSITEGGVFDQTNNKVKWGPYFDHTARTFNYQLVLPDGYSGGKNIDGFVSQDGVNTLIGGARAIEVGNPDLPIIDVQPIGGEAELGGSFTMTVSASGTVQGYQWYKDGQPLVGQVLPFLILSSVGPDDYGSYHVVVSGTGGSIQSNVVEIVTPTVVPNEPKIDLASINFLNIGGRRQMTLSASATPTKTYQVNIKSDLGNGPWNPIGPLQVANGDSITFLLDVTDYETAFFRVIEQ